MSISVFNVFNCFLIQGKRSLMVKAEELLQNSRLATQSRDYSI